MKELVFFICVVVVVFGIVSDVGGVSLVQDDDYHFVILSDTHIGASNSSWLLSSAIKKINSLVVSNNIKFVFITGDVTNSATTYQYAESRQLLDKLTIPYYPIIGNHDIWPYNSTWENDAPTGDQLFWETYKDKYAGILHSNLTVWNPENNCYSFFQNFEVKVGNIMFYALDFNSRHHAVASLGYKGSMPGADLYDFEDGTFQWFESRLAALKATKPSDGLQIVIMHHQPYRAPFPVPEEIYAFSTGEKDTLKALFQKYFPIPTYWGLFAGHFHMWENQTAFDEPEWKTFDFWETDACKNDSSFTLVHVTNGKIDTSDIQKLYGDQSFENQRVTRSVGCGGHDL